jgi:hypothetical protein
MRTIDKALAATVVAAVTFRALTGCGPSLPSASDQAAVGAYATALEACIVKAKLADAGQLADYYACKGTVNQMFGVPDGGQGVLP